MAMSATRIVVALVLVGHGVGHALGVLPAVGIRLSGSHSAQSWLFTSLLGDTAARGIGALLWTIGLVLFVGAGLGCLGWLVPTAWWRSLAISAAAVSLVTLALFWHGFPFLFPNKIGAIAVDVAVLLSVLWLRWPADTAVP